jgi:hypothetical protein
MAGPLVALVPLATAGARVLSTAARVAGRFGSGGSGGRGRLVRLSNNMIKRVQRLEKFVDELPPNAHKEFVKTTPIRTGNAKRKTRLVSTTIKADYPYANRLNEGYSRQATRGMTKPTIDYIRRELRKLK